MSDLYMKIGERIRAVRKQKLLTQEQLSEITGIHTNYIGVIERGERNITIESLYKIANGLNVPLEELFVGLDYSANADILSEIMRILSNQPTEDQKLFLEIIKSINVWKHNKFNN